jgi:hypothetical protein
MQEHTRAPPFTETIEDVRTHHKTVRVCNFTGTRDQLAAVHHHMEPHSVDVTVVEDPRRPEDVVDLVWQDTVQATSDADDLLTYVRAWADSMSTGLATDPPAVLERLADTFFESFDKRRTVMASRLVEFRAWNVGSGVMHTGFQNLGKVDYQRSTYQNFADSGVDVHVHGAPDRATTTDLDVGVHESTDPEVARHWWVAFDGDGDDEEKAVLLAEEREPGRFFGFWTYDAGVVDATLARSEHLAREADGQAATGRGAAGD